MADRLLGTKRLQASARFASSCHPPSPTIPFRYRNPVTGKWVRARHVARHEEIARANAECEIVGPPEIPSVDPDPPGCTQRPPIPPVTRGKASVRGGARRIVAAAHCSRPRLNSTTSPRRRSVARAESRRTDKELPLQPARQARCRSARTRGSRTYCAP
jgi:hypothetical protein